MFIGVYELDNKKYFNIYYKNSYGYEEWFKDTFSPECKYETLDFKIKGKSYRERQSCLEEIAKEWRNYFCDFNWSWGEIMEIESFFCENGKRYGLLKEFKENCIC